ncbi:MAG: ABC transporter substrate-binding protein [Hyphomicrobiaceae bacterium]
MACRFAALLTLTATAVLATALPAEAQKSGGTLRIYNTTQPPSASIHEESTIATNMPFMAVFNNLVRFDPTKPKNSFETIVPDLAESWAWDATGMKLSFKLRSGVTWHDGKPFTAKDVQCTWHRLNGIEKDYFRRSPRAIWYENLKEVTIDGDNAVTFHLTKPQPSMLAMLASGLSPVYPCHVSGREMRTKPMGTGPFKFVEFKSNESIRLEKNPNYWNKGKPYLDAIEWRIVTSRSTRSLAFVAGEFDLTFTGDITVPMMADIAKQKPDAVCQLVPNNVPINILVNRDRAPFDKAEVRRAVSLVLDRKGYVDIITAGKALPAANMMPPPEGQWGMPPEELAKLPGYGSVETQRAEAKKIMEGLGYGPNNRLKVKVATRDFATYKDPAVIFVDELNKIHFDAEMELVESSIWHSRLTKKDYTLGMNTSGVGIDDPDAVLKGAYACKSEANYTGYCRPDIEKLLDEQSQISDVDKRRKVVWEIERLLAEDVARPIIFHNKGATCWQAYVKGHTHQVNSLYNNWRFDTVWLDK